MSEIDWSRCDDAERSADTLHGAWRVRGHRIPVQGIIDNAEDFSGEEVAEMFELDVDVVKQILDFAAKR
jgi:uncharacterized protein (DUF433 family)